MFEDVQRPVIVAAHPDDETIGAGGQLGRLRDIRIIHLTDGAPRNGLDALARGFGSAAEYALARRRELIEALAVAGIGQERAECLGIPDQEASNHLSDLSRRLARILKEHGADLVLTHPYEGGHPDHDAAAFAVWAACQMAVHPVRMMEFTSYHANGEGFVTGCFLPAPGCEARTSWLSGEDRQRKRRMFACFRSQQDILSLFRDDRERFRPAPRYDFTRPPHPGRLHYEDREWGMKGTRWRELAARAAEDLCLSPS